jgi:cytochrome c biogenesis protein CcmG/thiol:disulfide interchange protein DsbE
VGETVGKPKKKSSNYTKPVQPSPSEVKKRPEAKAAPVRRRTARQRHQLRVRAFGALAVVVLAGTMVLAFTSNSMAGYKVGATDWSLPKLDGTGKVSLASLRGKPVVVNFFASWCRVCADELPVFAHDAVLLRGKVDIVEVNALETGNGSAFANGFSLDQSATAVLRDVGGSQGDGLYQNIGGSGSLPMTAFYGADGKLITTHLGGYNALTLAQSLQQIYGVSVPA